MVTTRPAATPTTARRPMRLLAVPLAALLAWPMVWQGAPVHAQGVPATSVRAEGGAAASTVFIRPVPGRVLAPFAAPDGPYGPGHRGVDLAADPGEAVHAAADGTVSFAGPVAGRGWITLDHGGGLRTTYGDVVASVARGATVGAGVVIGHLAGTAAHLDWGARLDGSYLDPMDLLRRWRTHLVAPSSVPRGMMVPVGG